MSFRDNLKAELSFQGVLVKDLADKTGIKKQTIDSYLCANARVPSADAAVKIARALQVSCEYLVTGEETAAGFRTLRLSPETRRIALYAEKLPPARKKLVLALTEELSGGEDGGHGA